MRVIKTDVKEWIIRIGVPRFQRDRSGICRTGVGPTVCVLGFKSGIDRVRNATDISRTDNHIVVYRYRLKSACRRMLYSKVTTVGVNVAIDNNIGRNPQIARASPDNI